MKAQLLIGYIGIFTAWIFGYLFTDTLKNQAADIRGTIAATLTEDAATISGQLSIKDIDAEQAFIPADKLPGQYGYLRIQADGHWTYHLHNTLASIQHLTRSSTLTDALVVTTVDGTEQTITLTIQGLNDPATIQGTDTAAITEEQISPITGALSITDRDTGEAAFQAIEQPLGKFGDFTLTRLGAWRYQLKQSPNIQALTANTHLIDTIPLTSLDGTKHRIRITIQGQDDAAKIGGLSEGKITEDDPNAITGKLTIDDPDRQQAVFNPTQQTDPYGTFSLQKTGQWRYQLTHDAAQALAHEQTAQAVFEVTSADASTHTIQLTIQGLNDSAEVSGNISGHVIDGETEGAQGQLSVHDVDTGENTFRAERLNGSFGTLQIQADGQWHYTLAPEQTALHALGQAAELTEAFVITTFDGTQQRINITLTGRNDPAQIKGERQAQVTEDTQSNASGQFTLDDPDTDESAFTPHTTQTQFGQFSLDHSGAWQYTLDNTHQDIQALGAGLTLADPITFTSIDGTEATLTIWVVGTNDPAQIRGDISAHLQEDRVEPISGRLSITDIDTAEALFQTQQVSDALGAFSLTEAGQWQYQLAPDSPVKHLRADEKTTLVLTVLAQDNTPQNITITLHGVNNPAQIKGVIRGHVSETQRSVSGILSITDDDHGEASFIASTQSGQYGKFTCTRNGHWQYRLHRTVKPLQRLGAGQTLTETLRISALDGTAQDITIQLQARNNRAIISGKRTANITHTHPKAQGQLTVQDSDQGEAHFAPKTAQGAYGKFTLTASGQWHYTLTQTHKLQALAENQSDTERFAIASQDGTPDHVTLTLQGRNDPAIIGGDVRSVIQEDDTHKITGQLSIQDQDSGQARFTAASIDGQWGQFTLTAEGAWDYALRPHVAAIQALNAHTTAEERIHISSVDGSTQALHITIQGHNDRAQISGTDQATIAEDSDTHSVTGLLQIKDVDANEARFKVVNKQPGDYGQFSMDASGLWVYRLNNASQHIQALTKGLSLIDAFQIFAVDQSPHTITITINGTDEETPAIPEPPTLKSITPLKPMSASVIEDQRKRVSLWLSLSDVNALEAAFTAAQTVDGQYGQLLIDAFGKWTYTLNNDLPVVQALRQDQSLTETLSASAIDGTQQHMYMTIHGSNDIAVIGGDTAATLAEGPNATIQGQLSIQDVDTGEAVFRAAKHIPGTYGTLSIDAQGHWAYALTQQPNALTSHSTDRITVTSADGTTQDIVITLPRTLSTPTQQ